jgi:hypothetical protein
MADLGVNVPHRGLMSIESAKRLGARWVRVVIVPDMFPSSLLQQYRAAGLSVLAVLANESFAGGDYGRQAEAYVRIHGAHVDAWQIGNEPDHESPSSWTLTQDEYAQLLAAAAGAIRRVYPSATIVGAGGVSGNPDYFHRGDILKWLDAVACHPYGQDADTCPAPAGNFGKASDLIGRYADLGLPVWVTEYGCDDRNDGTPEECARYIGALTAQFKADPRVRVTAHFCVTDAMVGGFGLLAEDGSLKVQGAAYKLAAQANGGTPVATLEERVAQLERQQSLQSEAIAAILANRYQDGPASAKGILVQLNPDKYKSLPVQEKANLA